MDYPRCLANRWQIGSGPVESGCKRLVTLRLNGAGMRWGERGTNTMCHLRALVLCHHDRWAHAGAASPPKPYLQNLRLPRKGEKMKSGTAIQALNPQRAVLTNVEPDAEMPPASRSP